MRHRPITAPASPSPRMGQASPRSASVVVRHDVVAGSLVLSATSQRADGSLARRYSRHLDLPASAAAARAKAAEALIILDLAAAAIAAVDTAREARASLVDLTG